MQPIVTIQITREGTTPGQKVALIKGALSARLRMTRSTPQEKIASHG
jgi:phenylpyruvate tautomerase PptA (4-oxalocrotonate tautomerase family)